jgi:hypothetical protein
MVIKDTAGINLFCTAPRKFYSAIADSILGNNKQIPYSPYFLVEASIILKCIFLEATNK